jgi:hypothetical protein
MEMGGYKLVARLLTTETLWVRIQTSLKIYNKQRSGQHTLSRQKNMQKIIFPPPRPKVKIIANPASEPALKSPASAAEWLKGNGALKNIISAEQSSAMQAVEFRHSYSCDKKNALPYRTFTKFTV